MNNSNEEMKTRQAEEAAFHDAVRSTSSPDYQRLTSNKKFYAITRQSVAFTEEWLGRYYINLYGEERTENIFICSPTCK